LANDWSSTVQSKRNATQRNIVNDIASSDGCTGAKQQQRQQQQQSSALCTTRQSKVKQDQNALSAFVGQSQAQVTTGKQQQQQQQ
jgi:hypothetical protein